MSEKEQEDEGFWGKISSINRVECPQCGHDNARGARACESCSASLPLEEEDEETYSTIIGEGTVATGKLKKVLLQDAKNLKNLRKAADGVESGALTAEEFRQIVKKIHNMTTASIKMFKSDLVKKKMEKLPEEEINLIIETQKEFIRFHDGVTLMMEYLKTHSTGDSRGGFNLAEDALTKLDKIQDKAIEMAASY